MGHVIEVKLSFEKMCYARNKDVGKETLLWLGPYGWLAQCSSINNVAKIGREYKEMNIFVFPNLTVWDVLSYLGFLFFFFSFSDFAFFVCSAT